MDEILLYGIIGDWWDGLDAQTVCAAINATSGDIAVRINSPGGYVMEGLTIFNALERVVAEGRKVTCYIDGLAASMASVIAMAGTDIIMAESSLMMIHNPWDCACGDAAELRKAADQLDRLKGLIVGIYAKQTGMAVETLSAMMDAETWLTPTDALNQHFITSTTGAATAQASFVKPFGFRKTPNHPLISPVAMARNARTASPVTPRKVHPMDEDNPAGGQGTVVNAPVTPPAAQPAATGPAALTSADIAGAVAAERTRVSQIRALGAKHRIDDATIAALIDNGTALDEARTQILDKLAERTDAHNVGGPITVTADARSKWLDGATNWLLVRSGVANMVQAHARAKGETLKLDPGEFRGVNLVDLARESLQLSGTRMQSRDPKAIVGAAFTARNEITQGTGDFTVLLENLMHKTLQAAYGVTPDTWSRFCGKGTVTDFRIFNRYLRGTFGALDSLDENGEFKNKAIPDGVKATIQAGTKGNIVSISRQAIINDDMGAFVSLATDLGRAAKLTIEKDVYALLASNPTCDDGNALFSDAHKNIAGGGWSGAPAAAAPSVAAFDAARVAMASQLDPSGNEILDIRPDCWVGPLGLEGSVRVIIGSQYDPDTANKLQRPNMVQNLVRDIVGTARITGTPWYFFGDKDMAPAIEVAFLNGVEEPFLDNELGWRVDGTEFKVRIDYGTAPVNWRSAFKGN